jgi:hypothetical protein
VVLFNSECPQEALEAVSTLIFAAARFSDLPELCDLRHTFTEKYGSSIESFVNQEVCKFWPFACVLLSSIVSTLIQLDFSEDSLFTNFRTSHLLMKRNCK